MDQTYNTIDLFYRENGYYPTQNELELWMTQRISTETEVSSDDTSRNSANYGFNNAKYIVKPQNKEPLGAALIAYIIYVIISIPFKIYVMFPNIEYILDSKTRYSMDRVLGFSVMPLALSEVAIQVIIGIVLLYSLYYIYNREENAKIAVFGMAILNVVFAIIDLCFCFYNKFDISVGNIIMNIGILNIVWAIYFLTSESVDEKLN